MFMCPLLTWTNAERLATKRSNHEDGATHGYSHTTLCCPILCESFLSMAFDGFTAMASMAVELESS